MKKLLNISSFLAVAVGLVLIGGSLWGICFTYQNVAREGITTPADASLPNRPVRGPLTLKIQADSIRAHMLQTTRGKTYAEMPRQIQKVDEYGNPVLDTDGNPVMVANTARDMWITATTLITALNLGILTYVFSGLVLLFGCISVWTGIVFWMLGRSRKMQ